MGPDQFSWVMIAYGAGAVALIASAYASAAFRADPQPERARAAFWWSVAGNSGLLAMLGAGMGFAFIEPSPAIDALRQHMPHWLAVFIARAGPWILMLFLMNFAGAVGILIFGRPTEHPVLCRKNFGNCTPWFAACRRYALLLGHTYKVFVTGEMLSGARVRGTPVPPETPDDATLQLVYWVTSINESLYERMDVTKPEFLALHRKNFQIRWREIEDTEFDPDQHWGMRETTNSGTLILHLKTGKKLKLVLLGDQDGAGLARKILEAAKSGRAAEEAFAPPLRLGKLR